MLRALVITLLLIAGPAAAQVYRCEGAEGRLVYSDRPCRTEQKQTVMADKVAEARAVELVARCNDPLLVLEAPGSAPVDALSTRDERMTAGQAYSWEELRRTHMRSTPLRLGFHRSGTLHVCAAGDTRREFVILADGRTFDFEDEEQPQLLLSDTARDAANACGRKLRNCAERSTTPLDTCIRAIPACELGDPDCCPGECLSQFRCWSNRAPSPIEAYQRAFAAGCPAAAGAERCL